ncbi:MAG: PDZ domain-containing protein, partial [Chitinophagaceae bacterium]
EMVKKTIDDLLKHGKVLRGYLGIIISDMTGEKAKVMGVNITAGVLVDSVQPNGAAMMAGMAGKDIITKIDNHNIETSPQLREIIARHKPGEKIYITVTREGKEKVIPVTLMPVQQIVAAEIPVNQILTTLGIEIENLSGKEINQLKITGGVKVVSISTGKINRYTNMQAGFIITGVNGKAVKNKEEFIREIKDKKGGIMLEGIYPGATGVYYYAFGL